jgi:uncharacterized membrane protein HdeD (DUF308 family)
MFKSTSTSLILTGVLAVIVGIIAIAWPGVTVLALALLFGLYSLVYGFTQISAGVQVRQLGKSFQPFSELKNAA